MSAERVLEQVRVAREAVGALRDATREGQVLDFWKRDPLVVAIHDALDVLLDRLGRPSKCQQDIIDRFKWAAERMSETQIDRALSEVSMPGSRDGPLSVTRVEVITEGGRAFARWNCRVTLAYQDEGRTLKLFVAGGGREAEREGGGMVDAADLKSADTRRAGSTPAPRTTSGAGAVPPPEEPRSSG